MNPNSSSSNTSELLKVKFQSDRTAYISVGGRPEKRVGAIDAITWLRNSIPELAAASVSSAGESFRELKMGRYLVSVKDTNDDGSNKRVLLYRPENRGPFRLEFNNSGGSELPVHRHFWAHLINHYGLDEFNRILSTFGMTYDLSNRILTVDNLLYPNMVCQYDMCRLSEPDKDGNKLFGVQGNVYYKATSSPLTTVWATTTSISDLPKKFNIPLSNFFSEGTMCWGTINRVDKFTDNGNLRQLDYNLDIIMSSNFNFDLCHMAATDEYIHFIDHPENDHLKKLFSQFDNYNEGMCTANIREIGKEYIRYLMFVFYLANPETRSFPYHLFGA